MKKIKKEIFRLAKNQLFAGSFIMFFGNGLASFFNYFYHLLMGRMLGPADYGLLSSLISINYLLTVPINALNLVVVKYVSELRGKKNLSRVLNFYWWLNKRLMVFVVLALGLTVVLSGPVADFLHLESRWNYYFIVASGLLGIYFTLNLSILQGFLKFGLMITGNVFQSLLKVSLAVLLVAIGWQVKGAVLSFTFSTLIGFIFAFWLAQRILGSYPRKNTLIDSGEIFKYGLPAFISILAFTSLYTTDVFLARHFLSPAQAGLYAALATLGKVIYFAINPVIMAMFPMVSERHARGYAYGGLMLLASGLVFLICLGVGGLYIFLPKLMIGLLYGQDYFQASPYLWLVAVFLTFYSFAYLLVNFFLSIRRVGVAVYPLAAAVFRLPAAQPG